MSDKPTGNPVHHRLEYIDIDLIDIPPVWCSSKMDEEASQYFKATIEKYGLLQPIVVCKKPDGRYRLVAGRNRLLALKERGEKKVPAIVLEGWEEKDLWVMHLAENLARGKVDPISVAEALKAAIDSGASVEELAKALGRSKQWVKFYLTLLDLPDWVKQALREGKLTVSHIREAMRLPTPEEIDAALQTAMKLGWSASTLKQYVDVRLAELEAVAQTNQGGPPPPPPSPEEAQEMIRWRQCAICGRNVPAEYVRMPMICEDCYKLLSYVVQCVGTGEEAMNTIYEALRLYSQWQQYRQQFLEMKTPARETFFRQLAQQQTQQIQATPQTQETPSQQVSAPQVQSVTVSDVSGNVAPAGTPSDMTAIVQQVQALAQQLQQIQGILKKLQQRQS